MNSTLTVWRRTGIGLGVILALGLSGCDNVEMPKFLKKNNAPAAEDSPVDSSSITLVERDVEAPDVFDVTDLALWDGRPSLGGVWVAYPDNIEPERVIIRNTENKKFVIGALFKRERDNPGPKIQLSSDAAAALGILAGLPTSISVTALIREAVPDAASLPAAETASDGKTAKDKTTDPIAAATAALDKVEANEVKSAPLPAKSVSALDKPYIQIGIFSVEDNAANTATSLRTQGILPIVKAQESKGKKFWRVLVGPAGSTSERASLLKKARDLGFTDAYFVTN